MPERQSQELKTSGAQIDESEFEKPRTLGKKKKNVTLSARSQAMGFLQWEHLGYVGYMG